MVHFNLILLIVGESRPKSRKALKKTKEICEDLNLDYTLMVIDLQKNPSLKEKFNVSKTPLLIRVSSGKPSLITEDMSQLREKIETLISFTKYAPAHRLSKKQVKRQIELIVRMEGRDIFLSKIPSIFIIVNTCRQLVYMNKGALKFTGLDEIASVIGKRPGEVLGCVHAEEEDGGCGTSESCTYCGAVNAVLTCQKNGPNVQEAHLVLGPNQNAYDLRIWAAPLTIKNESFSALTIQDISHEKRRRALERVFFHDVFNIASALFGHLQIITDHKEKIDLNTSLKDTLSITTQLIEEIRAQQILSAAENGHYRVNLKKLNNHEIIRRVIEIYANHEVGQGKLIRFDLNSENFTFQSDESLIHRILGNMVKNALEATEEGNSIHIGCERQEQMCRFWVRNRGYIPRDVQLRIFQRSFSTKGTNRGLGTYSMKLLSSYLHGEVGFTTSQKNGTEFTFSCPLVWDK